MKCTKIRAIRTSMAYVRLSRFMYTCHFVKLKFLYGNQRKMKTIFLNKLFVDKITIVAEDRETDDTMITKICDNIRKLQTLDASVG